VSEQEPMTQVFLRSDGSEVLVTVWSHRPTPLIEVAERERTGDTWGPPLKERDE
jgi:hypothetical protein